MTAITTMAPSPAALRRIYQLPQDVINRIAAGEVIHRPSSALKEMLENSLDAGASSIVVTCKTGGLKLLQIQDNGHGIQKSDFPLVCERFATSKLASFEDLLRMTTYGFRGEALASISHCARVGITSMTAGSPCAYRANFGDGKMLAEPQPCAGVKGTTITVEDMFYNVPARRAAIKSPSEEYGRLLDVCNRYAIHHASLGPAGSGVGVTCKKHGELVPDCHMPAKTSVLDAIGIVYGQAVRRELIAVAAAAGGDGDATAAVPAAASNTATAATQEAPRFKVAGYVSNANYSMKKPCAIVFINHRLVECAPLKKAIENIYADILPRHTHPFIYLAIDLPPGHVDVNVHPTKREVSFLFQDAMVEAVAAAVKGVLAGANTSRSFATQTLLPVTPLAPAGSDGQGQGAIAALLPGAAAAMSKVAAAGRASALPLRAAAAAAASAPADMEAWPSSAAVENASEAATNVEFTGVFDISAAVATAVGEQADIVSDGLALGTADNGSVSVKVREASAASAGGAAPISGRKRSAIAAGLSGPSSVASTGVNSSGSAVGGSGSGSGSGIAPKKMVRVDSTNARIDSFLVARSGSGSMDSNRKASDNILLDLSDDIDASIKSEAARVAQLASTNAAFRRTASGLSAAGSGSAARQVQLTSVAQLLAEVEADSHAGLERILRRCTFVGVVTRDLCLVQHEKLLLLINHTQLARELFYQQILGTFGDAQPFALVPAVEVASASLLALESNGLGHTEERPKLAAEIAKLLATKAEMLREYFSIGFEVTGDPSSPPAKVMLTHLPHLVDGHVPPLALLPDLLVTLAYDVAWTEEKPCFRSLAQTLAAFYADPGPPTLESGKEEAPEEHATSFSAGARPAQATMDPINDTALRHGVGNLLLPALQRHAGFKPPSKLARGHYVVQVASTEQLYKIFERC